MSSALTGYEQQRQSSTQSPYRVHVGRWQQTTKVGCVEGEPRGMTVDRRQDSGHTHWVGRQRPRGQLTGRQHSVGRGCVRRRLTTDCYNRLVLFAVSLSTIETTTRPST